MKQSRSVNFRPILISAVLIPLNSYWMVQLELVWGGTYPSVLSLPFTVVFSVFAVILLNLGMKRIWPRNSLNQGELLTIYVMTMIGSSLSGCDALQTLVHLMSSPFHFATPENEWKELFHAHIPNWLSVSDEKVLEGFFEGNSSFWLWENFRAWLPRIAVWTGFTSLLLFTTLCLNIIFRKQWIENEKLAYPIVKLPYEIARERGSVLKRRMFWIGFSVAAIINIINGLSFIFPQIPMIPVKARWIRFSGRPWNSIRFFSISFYPFVVGMGFLMPLGLSFSCWFFFLFWKVEQVVGRALALPNFPSEFEQTSGVWMGILLFVLWMERGYLKGVFRRIVTKNKAEDLKEPLSYRIAFLGVVLGFSAIVLFFVKAGMSPWFAVLYFLIYFALAIMIARIRAELGPPIHDMMGAGPDNMMVSIFGTRRLQAHNLTLVSLLHWINRVSYRNFPMAHQLEGFKLAEQGNINTRRLSYAMILAVLMGTVSGFFVVLNFSYDLGSAVKLGGPARNYTMEGYRRLTSWLSYPTETDFRGLTYMLSGFIFSVSLLLMRTRFLWFPLHPIGYAVSYWWAMSLLWFPIFLSFMIKTAILRFGGINMYRKAVPFFLGLMLGEYAIGGVWSIIAICIGKRLYAFWV